MKQIYFTTLIAGLSYLLGATSLPAQNPDTGGTRMSLNQMLEKADSLFNGGQYDTARAAYLEVWRVAEDSKDISSQAEAGAMIARAFLISGKKDEGRPWFEKAGMLATPDLPLAWSRFLGVRGRFEWQDKNISAATATFKAMYQYCSERRLHERAIDAAHMVAITGRPDEQIEWGKKGIREAEEGNIPRWLGPLWNNLGATYEDRKQYKDALEAYLKARDYHYRFGTERNKLIADWAVGHTYRMNGEPEQAEKWLHPLLEWCAKLDEEEFLGLTNRELGELALMRSRQDDALRYFLAAEEKLSRAGMPEWDADGFKKIQERIAALKSAPE